MIQFKADSIEDALRSFAMHQRFRSFSCVGIRFMKDCGNGTYKFYMAKPKSWEAGKEEVYKLG